MALEPGTIIGKYKVRRKLAEGGMAEIYLCSQQGPAGFEKDAVIKRIRSFLADDPEFVQMFKAEARLASRLNHANIVQVFDFDQHEDTWYLAMEYVRGKSLWDLRRRSRELMMPVPPTLVAHIGADVARGLDYAHRLTERGQPLNLVHRDVTPHNVLLSYEGAVKLADFGIAKAGNKLTSPGMLKGKFAYMSPEQARGDQVDSRTDVFALGIVLWEMLTGAKLFDGDSDVAVLRAVQHSVIASPGRLNPEVHADLDAVVMRALERDPEQRYASAHELERALRQHILKHASSIEETDLGLFLRRLFADELVVRGDGHEGTSAGTPMPEPPEPKKKDPTAVMPGRSPSGPHAAPPPPDPDEDLHAATHVVDRAAGPRKTLPLSTGPGRPTLRAEPGELPTEKPAPEPVTHRNLPAVSPRPPSKPAERAPLNVAEPSSPPGRKSRGPWVVAAVGIAVVAIAGGAAVVMRAPAAAPPPETLVSPVLVEDAGTLTETDTPDVVAREPVAPPEPDAGSPAVEIVAAEPPDAGTPPEVPSPPTTPVVTAENPVEQSPGTLVVTATPFAQVYIDGQDRGEVVGRRQLELAPGRYYVRITHPKKTVERMVVIRSGKRQQLKFEAVSN